jgi:hypothetical protein
MRCPLPEAAGGSGNEDRPSAPGQRPAFAGRFFLAGRKTGARYQKNSKFRVCMDCCSVMQLSAQKCLLPRNFEDFLTFKLGNAAYSPAAIGNCCWHSVVSPAPSIEKQGE